MISDTSNDTIIEQRGSLGIIILNRPAALNALSEAMIRDVARTLTAWADYPSIHAIALTGAGDRAFCAGGDIKAAYQAGLAAKRGEIDASVPLRFFADEYRLNRQMAHYPKPLIALINGIVMGGGYGLAGQCRFRVACPATRFAMPEVGIGFFPDVGSAWHLARMPGRSGYCLGLTGMTVGPGDICFTGVATHFMDLANLALLPERLAEALGHGRAKDMTAHLGLQLDQYALPCGDRSELAENRSMVDAIFSLNDCEAIIVALREAKTPFADKLFTILGDRSPSSLAVTARHLAMAGQDVDFDATIARDFVLAGHFLQGEDFYEGIRAALIDRDKNPMWQAPSFAPDSYFEPGCWTLDTLRG